jgi:hypothetical protein
MRSFFLALALFIAWLPRGANAQGKTCSLATLRAGAPKVNQACCCAQPPCGHRRRRRLQGCALPRACPSRACAAQIELFYDSCQQTLRTQLGPKFNARLAHSSHAHVQAPPYHVLMGGG